MSLIFDALKKEQGRPASPVTPSASASGPEASRPAPIPTPTPASSIAQASALGWISALLAGMVLAGGGAWLYWAGKTSDVNRPVIAMPATAPALVPVPAVPVAPALPIQASVVVPPAPVVVAVPTVPMVPTAHVVPVSPVVPVVATTPALVKVVKVAAPAVLVVAPVVEVKPPVRAPINTQVVVSVEVNQFEVREAFQSFLQLLQLGQLTDAQIAADKISTAMGRNHVMSLRAQGYLALKKNDLVAAKRQYLQLNQLLPEDRESGLNLALIDWRLGEKESAAKRVSGLLEKFPNDSEIQALNLNVRNP